MSSPTRIAAVTGANKGIGLAIVRNLALQYPKSAFNNGPIIIYLTARDQARGEQALKELQNDPQLRKAKALTEHGGLATIRYHRLDILDKESIDSFATHLKKEHRDGIDVLINNAGIMMSGFDLDVVKTTLQSNYYATLQATTELLPHIRDGGRLVNVASTMGTLGRYSESLRTRFRNAKSVSETTALMEEFTKAVAENDYQRRGWPTTAYGVSKAGMIGITRAFANDARQKGSKTLINACCPGYVQTDMTRGGGYKTPDQGAQTPVMLALGDIGGASGQFWSDRKPQAW